MRRLHCALLLALVATACSMGGVRGSGNVVEESREVRGFSSVQLEGAGDLIIDQTGENSLKIRADDNLLPLLTSEVRGSELVLGTKRFTSINPSKKVVYNITVKSLDGISIAGSGNATARGINTDRLKVSVAGEGKITAEGEAARQEIN